MAEAASVPAAPAAPADRPRGLARRTTGQWLGLTAGLLVVAALVGITLCLVALHRLSDARTQVVDRVDPARIAATSYLTALVDQETGVRGYALSGRPAFLQPYRGGARAAALARRRVAEVARTRTIPGLAPGLAAVEAAERRWQTGYAQPVVAASRAPARRDLPDVGRGKALFDDVRRAFARLDARLVAQRVVQRRRLAHAADIATAAVIVAGLLLLAAALATSLTLRRIVTRPLARLASDARRVARGAFDHVVRSEGPRDIAGLGGDVESMRRRIVAELAAVEDARRRLEVQAVDLRRSNSELEQFAYVASHDLQEPLRKVAAFCGMLRKRYHGQLDERADQYIDYAVDGAVRMQALINDLLAFSRVGRVGAALGAVDMAAVAAAAQANLAAAIEEFGATVEIDGELPELEGDASLLTALLQNLIGNAIKFHGDAPPHVRVSAQPEGDGFRFAVDDNGIGIEPRFAERVFIIFQRLHTKEEYSGTGIGLALCRKIVEFHGGRIWLEPDGALGGAGFRFTLPRTQAEAPT